MQALISFLKLGVWVVCWACAACHAAPTTQPNGGDANASFAGWLDDSGAATLAQVQTLQDWAPFVGWKNWAYGPEPVWLRVQVPAATSAGTSPWILVVRPAFIDKVTFYDPSMGVERHSGDFLPPTDDALGGVLFSFEVPALPVARQIYIKLQGTNSRVVHLSLMPRAQAQAYARSFEWSMGAILVLSAIFWVWTLTVWLQTGDRVMGFFALKQLMISLWSFSILGFARITIGDWFSEGTLSTITNLLAGNGVASAFMLFYAALLAEYQARTWMLTVMWVAALVLQVLGLLNFVGQAQLSLQIINAAGPLLLLWVVLTLWIAKPNGVSPPISQKMLLIYVFLYAALNSLPAMTYMGWIEPSPILLVGNISLLVADGLVMLVILSVRQRRFKAKYQVVNTQLQLQQEQARLDQQYLKDQSQLLAMLAHEMKTPLANMRIWMEAGPKGRPVMERAIQDMNRVIERCVHTGQLNEQSLQPHNEKIDAAELTHSVLAACRQPDRLRLFLPTEVCALTTDAQMLSIVLSNIVENAFKYSASESPIDVRLCTCAGYEGEPGWRWSIANTVGSSGLPDAEKVFDKYYRGPFAQRQSGSGLGLFLVKSLLALMQGRVAYTPLDDRVWFEVWLPVQAGDIKSK